MHKQLIHFLHSLSRSILSFFVDTFFLSFISYSCYFLFLFQFFFLLFSFFFLLFFSSSFSFIPLSPPFSFSPLCCFPPSLLPPLASLLNLHLRNFSHIIARHCQFRSPESICWARGRSREENPDHCSSDL